jgi:hypothetical protein
MDIKLRKVCYHIWQQTKCELDVDQAQESLLAIVEADFPELDIHQAPFCLLPNVTAGISYNRASRPLAHALASDRAHHFRAVRRLGGRHNFTFA